ncbi:Solute-binding protein family 3/N-terminal domain of MltF [Dillenia turbinata]|uniref:Solute-binding protein family 3/N-terminal domain of MltF n=1 Tax=Dillenia turbinata TaxID=194707 RepID=A0AAN8ZH78_9MAGN
MDSLEYPLFFFLIGLLVLFSPETIAVAGKGVKNSITLGAIMDNSSRAGREGIVAMELAIDDINNSPGNVQFSLKIRDSQREPLKAALAAMDLVGKQKVQAILGLSTWAESSLVADRCSQDQVPFLSLSDSTPHWATNRYSFLVQASRDKYAQMKAIAAIVGSYGWKQVIVIYEDIDFATSGIIPQLANALKDEESQIIQLLALKPFASSVAYLSEELERLKMSQARVFVVHSSLSLALNIFKEAKNLGMMEKDCVWITTDSIASQVHSINSASYSSMEGVLGVKTYFHQNGSKFLDFYSKFSQKFHAKYPEEDKNEPGYSALQAYDAVWTLAQAMKGNEMRSQNLLDNISATSFHGLTGTIGFRLRHLAAQNLYQIINIYQNRYQELGFWLEGSGFSKTSCATSKHNVTMKSLKRVIWPGGISTDPRGWALPTKEKPLRILVPASATFKEFVRVDTDSLGKENFTGYSIDVFKEAVRRLPYDLHYKFIPKDGFYNPLVEQVYLKKYDALVGDISIAANRCQFVEFTQPYTEGGLVMIVPVKAETSNREWLFMKPFTNGMWVLTGAVNVYNGFVVWLIERNYNAELKGSLLTQCGTLIWISFTTLFTLQSDNLHSNLSRWAMMIWLFVALIISQSYTASLTSMLTVQRLIPTVIDVETLKKNNDMVGCAGSFIRGYLVDVLGFSSDQIKNFTSDGYPEAFHNGQIKAAFFELPYAKVFLAKHKEFAAVPPKYEFGGQLGFVFPKKSLFLADISEAVLNVSESGKLRDLEKKNMHTVENLNLETEDDYDSLRLSYQSFWALFLITAGTSTVSLVIHIIGNKLHSVDAVMENKGLFGAIQALIKRWKRRKSQLSARVHDGENAITSMVHSIDPVSLSFMQGVLGVKGYFSESGENIKLFSKRFSERFHAKYPHEENYEPGIFAIHAYNAVAENNYPVQENNFTGFSIDVFKVAIEYLPYPLQYEFHNYCGPSYDDLVKKIYSKVYDAVVGDVGIISKRFQGAEFSHPNTEPGLLMVSPVQPQTSHKAWLFVRPFTVSMWALTGVINGFNGFVVWIIERNHCSELRRPFLNQVGTLLWLAFNTLFSVHVITQSYLANLTSMLTLQKFEATVKDVEEMNNSKAIIGCGKSSYVYDYLVNVLLFDENRVKRYGTPEEYDEGFRNRSIVAAFMEAPLAKAFPKGSRLVPDMTEALLKAAKQGKLAELVNGMIASETCRGELLLECKTTWRQFLAVFKRMHQKREHLPQKQNDIEIGPSGFAAVQSPAGH